MITVVLPETFTFTKDGIKRIGLAMKATLIQNHWSARELARKANLGHGTVNRYLNSTVVRPQEDVIRDLAPYIYRVTNIDIQLGAVNINPEETYKDNWKDLARLGTDAFFDENHSQTENCMEILKELINSEIQKLGITLEEYARRVRLSPSVLKEIISGNIPGNQENKLGKLAPNLTNPQTGYRFSDVEELVAYCNLKQNPAHNEQDHNSRKNVSNGV